MLTKEKREGNKEYFISKLKNTKRKGILNLLKFLEDTDFYRAPASSRFHNACPGGLVDHSIKVYKLLFVKNRDYKRKIPEDSVIICGLLHDISKINNYLIELKWTKSKATGNQWIQQKIYVMNKDRLDLGHGEGSVIELMKFIDLTDLEKAMIRFHMGLSLPKEQYYALNNTIRVFPQMCILITSDYEAAVLYEENNYGERLPVVEE